jgi:hypothetical protein
LDSQVAEVPKYIDSQVAEVPKYIDSQVAEVPKYIDSQVAEIVKGWLMFRDTFLNQTTSPPAASWASRSTSTTAPLR